jgi:tetratricopeptide (TPR) repeat protein/predicted Ser/Thr protein kinase
MRAGCVQPEEIDALLGGALSAAHAERIEAHLDACRDCRVLVGRLAQDSAFAARASEAIASSETLRSDVTADTLAEDAAPPSSPSIRAPRPLRIGRYLVERKLGAGGMGVVYLADDPELRRKVVIKLLRAAASGPQDRARLLREAQAMAQVSHPNVVPIYDVGVHDDQVFLAMEFIDGADLAAWLREPRGVRETVEVFAGAGRGLAAAHRAGLVHRDFKPHNVMLARTGEVKVTDFGLARADAGEPDAAPAADAPGSATLLDSPITHTGALVGTPAYMAPEQIRGEPVDARSDQFSFCVALYEALYGERPFRGTTLTELFDSTLEGFDERRLEALARRRRVPAHVRRVVRRGLRAEPAERFPSMDALLAELAPRASRRAIAAAAAAGAAVLAVTLYAALDRRGGDPAALCTGGAAELEAVWSPERRQAIEAAFAALDLEALRAGTGPGARPGARSFAVVAGAVDAHAEAWRAGHRRACEATRVRGEQTEEVMELRMRCLRRRRAELDALLDVLARPDRELLSSPAQIASGLTSPAACDQVEALAAARPPADPGKRAEIERIEGVLAKGLAQLAVLRYEPAAAQLAEALAAAERTGHRPLIAEIQLQRGLAAVEEQGWADAEERLHRAVELAEQAGDDRVRALAFVHLVGVAANTGRYGEAERWTRYAQATIERLGGDRALLAPLDLRVAEAQRARGQAKQAEATYRRAIERLAAVHGAQSREVGLAHRDLAMALSEVNEHERAFAELARARDVLLAAFGPDNPEAAATTGLMGSVRYDQKRFDEALALGREEQGALLRYFGASHPLVAQSYQAQALRLQGIGRSDEAIAMMKRAVAIMAEHHGERHPLHASTLGSLALLYANLQRHDEAYDTWARGLEIYRALYGTDAHTDVTTLLNAMGTMRRRQGRHDEAAALYERARAALEKFQQPDGRLMADVLTRLGMVEVLRGRHAEAIRVLEQALAARVAAGAAPSLMSWTKLELARALWDGRRDRPRAVALARQARAEAKADHDAEQLEAVEQWLASHAPG